MKKLIIIATLVLLFYCSKQETTYTVEIIDGVKYIHNLAPLWGDEPMVKLEFVQKIGELESEDENYNLYFPFDVVCDKDQSIYILDTGNYRIQKFDSDGNYIQTIGRQGQGPVEFGTNLRGLDITNDSLLYIPDLGNQRVQILSLDGKYIDKYNMPLRSSFKFLRVLSSGLIAAQPVFYVRPDIPLSEIPLIGITDEKGDLVGKIGHIREYANTEITESMNRVVFEIDDNSDFWVAYTCQNLIERYNSEKLLTMSIIRPIDFSLPDSPKSRFDAKNVSTNLGIDSHNRVWVSTICSNEDRFRFDIFDNQGFLLGYVSHPEVGIVRIFEDRLFIVNPQRPMCVYEYRIVELED